MNRRRSRFAPALSLEGGILESRVVLSAMAVHPGGAQIAAETMRQAATKTTVTETAGTLGQPITFTVKVRTPASAGPAQGTVNLVDHGQVIGSLTLAPAATSGRFAYSEAISTLTAQAGGGAYFFGKHQITATFVPGGGGFRKSSAKSSFTVTEPNWTTLAGGVQVATIEPGSGPEIQSGQTASMLYTGYLAKTGKIFDDSSIHGGAPFRFQVGSGQVIPGFDAAATGMKVGESRVVTIPPAEGYGSTASGTIPANSTLVFVLTLTGIS